MSDLSAILDVAKRAALAGADAVEPFFQTDVDVRRKDSTVSFDLVSEADLASERAVLDVIQAAFPEHGILSEETRQDEIQQEHLWIVDPIDGTNNFLHGIPHFGVSVAYYRRGQAACGVVYNPATKDCYEAIAGEGAQRNGASIQVAGYSTLDRAMIGVGFYYDRGAMMKATLESIAELFSQQIHGIRRFGTASLDLCQVACGMFGAFFEYQLSPWDFAAGQLIVKEAGGEVTTCEGQRLPTKKTSLLASNGRLHEQLVAIVGPRSGVGQTS